MQALRQCGISDAEDFHSLWKLPRLPLTERFGPYYPRNDLAYDQELVMSVPTGHVQLRYQLDPQILYTNSEYTFRTGSSSKSRSGVHFFVEYFQNLTGGQIFTSLVDVGGNDLFVARQLSGSARHTAVIDPICAGEHGKVCDGVQVVGRFIEQIDLSRDLPQPDLVICRHTLEHLAQPRVVIEQWFKQCHPDCLYFVEVPCFESLVESLRFDAVFHQHFHYYDLASLRSLIWQCGGEYLNHTFNYQGSCGGNLIVVFRRAQSPQPKPVIDLPARTAYFERRISEFRAHMDLMSRLLGDLPKPVFGYGAGLMLATLAYHLKTDLSGLHCVLDDDPARDGATYENLPVKVRHTAKASPPPNSCYLITSLENIRPIYRRIQDLNPRRILIPLLS